jgi:hypothetical protein
LNQGDNVWLTIKAIRMMTSKGASRLPDVKADKNPMDVKGRKIIEAVQAEAVSRATANQKEDGC